MIILSHRGYWEKPSQKNTKVAIQKSFQCGFGLETDLRDLAGSIVISHDPPIESSYDLDELFTEYRSNCSDLIVALNIKADGLQDKLKQKLNKYSIQNYFVFDMSVPDTIGYIKKGIRFYTRQSEYESTPVFYNRADGVWMDEFKEQWINEEIVEEHIRNKKKVCIVSPELHGHKYKRRWDDYKKIERKLGSGHRIMLCTDHPDEARIYFND